MGCEQESGAHHPRTPISELPLPATIVRMRLTLPMTLHWLALAAAAGGVLLAAASVPADLLAEWIAQTVAAWGWGGMIGFTGLYVVATLLLLPGWIFTVAAGAVYGLWQALLLVSLASTTTAALAFLIARYLARERVARWAARWPKFQALDRALAHGGWRVVALVRLSPVIPFGWQNYLYGLTPIRFGPYLFASWAAMLPGTLLYVYLGYLGGAGLEAARGERSWGVGRWTLTGLGLIATIAVTVYLTRLARRANLERRGLSPHSRARHHPRAKKCRRAPARRLTRHRARAARLPRCD